MSFLTDEPTIDLDHPKWQRAEVAVFTRRVVADCMNHRCTIVDGNRVKLDACCQYGCDVDLTERDAILARADQIKPVPAAEVRDLPWFDESNPERDPDTPSGTVVRTAVHGEGCLFLIHDRRGCAVLRVWMGNGWDFRGGFVRVFGLLPVTFVVCV